LQLVFPMNVCKRVTINASSMLLFELHTKWLVAKSGSLTLIVNIDYLEILQHRIYPLNRGTR